MPSVPISTRALACTELQNRVRARAAAWSPPRERPGRRYSVVAMSTSWRSTTISSGTFEGGASTWKKPTASAMAFSTRMRRAKRPTGGIVEVDGEQQDGLVGAHVGDGDRMGRARVAAKLLYLAIRHIERKWRAAPTQWRQALNQLDILFGDRLRRVS